MGRQIYINIMMDARLFEHLTDVGESEHLPKEVRPWL